MAATIKQTEAIPANYPTTGNDAIWQRIEAYIAHRFTERAVTWIVEGCGEWEPPLKPATLSTSEIWNGAAWEAIEAPDAPLGGYWLSGEGPYRFTATVGDGDVPEAVMEAFNRLQSHLSELADADMPEGVSSYTVGIGEVREGFHRDANAIAQAIQNSGAADLLRPYRKV